VNFSLAHFDAAREKERSMHVLHRYVAGDSLRLLSDEERRIGRMVFEKSFEIKNDENVLIVCDPNKREEASVFFESARRYTSNLSCLIFEGMTENAQEPPADVLEAMRTSDIAILTTSYSLSHTQARRAASTAGARVASMPDITLEMMKRILVTDPRLIRGASEKIAARLTAGDQVIITSPQGSHLSFSISGRAGIPDTGILTQPGEFGNLPAGEAFIAPVEGTANGVLIVDGAIADIELDAPVRIFVADGIAESIRGGSAARELTRRMNEAGDQARVLCELGIGANPAARLCANVLEAEKVYGTCHVAFGDNSTFGGTNFVPFHTDCVIADPTLTIDTRVVVRDKTVL
jgi:leucyl aminopeptidase (aminopeptidase T)